MNRLRKEAQARRENGDSDYNSLLDDPSDAESFTKNNKEPLTIKARVSGRATGDLPDSIH